MKRKTYVCCEPDCGEVFRVCLEKQPWKPQPQEERDPEYCPFCGFENIMEQED